MSQDQGSAPIVTSLETFSNIKANLPEDSTSMQLLCSQDDNQLGICYIYLTAQYISTTPVQEVSLGHYVCT